MLQTPTPRAACALLMCLALAACGGGSDEPPSPAPSPSPSPAPSPAPAPAPIASGTAALQGEWVSRHTCTPLGGGQSAHQLVQIVRQSDSAVDYRAGVLVYPRGDCQGTGSAMSSPMGTVSFARIDSNASVAAHWGTWRTVTGTASAVVWAKTSDTTLCLLGDESPSILPTLDHVARSAAVQQQQNACYAKR